MPTIDQLAEALRALLANAPGARDKADAALADYQAEQDRRKRFRRLRELGHTKHG